MQFAYFLSASACVLCTDMWQPYIAIQLYELWHKDALSVDIKEITDVVATFERHKTGLSMLLKLVQIMPERSV